MKHPSRWPWVLRFPLCVAVILIVWWGPLALMFYGLSRWSTGQDAEAEVEWVLGALGLIGWSAFIMRVLVHPIIEPFFQHPVAPEQAARALHAGAGAFFP